MSPSLPPHSTAPEVARLVAPLDPARFFAEHWERQPVVLARSDAFDELFALRNFDAVVTQAEASVSAVRTVDGKSDALAVSEVGRVPNVHALRDAWHRGYTLVAKFLHRYWPALGRYCQALEAVLHHGVGVNAYFSPPRAQGFGAHGDGHEVFVVQSYGSKRWRVYEPPGPRPLDGQTFDLEVLGEPIIDCQLRAGEGLYIPRGFPHVVVSGDEASFHLTLSVKPRTLGSVLADAVALLQTRDPRFAETVPVGWRNDPGLADALVQLGQAATDPATIAAVVERARRDRWALAQPGADGHFLRQCELEAIDEHTTVAVRGRMPCEVSVELTTATIHFPGRSLALPSSCIEALRRLATLEPVTVASLPGPLDAPGRRTMVTTLVRAGLLEFWNEAPPV